ncbi:hypothetical protein AAHE18_06G094100 [Arachis hypogaea]
MSLPTFFDSFCFRGTLMNPRRTQRFKRVAEPEKKKKSSPTKSSKFSAAKPKRISESKSATKMEILPSSFFQIDALDLAPRLLGKFLRRDDVVLQITEVEAYRPNDSACHGRFGITSRTAPVEGAGAAVLIRSCAPISGLNVIQQRRGLETDKPILLTGPGKVGQALGLSTEWSNHPLYTPGGLELLDGPKPENILVGPRVGIQYASPVHINALWRFAIAGSPWISAPKNTLRAPL